MVYFLVGLSYFGESGFNFGFDLGLLTYTMADESSVVIPYASLKLGRRF